jgi:hypothetical protein
MTQPADVQSVRARRSFGAVLLIAACALACTLPIIGGLVAGTVVDRVLDSPTWLALAAAIVAGVAVMLTLRRRGIGRSNGC